MIDSFGFLNKMLNKIENASYKYNSQSYVFKKHVFVILIIPGAAGQTKLLNIEPSGLI
jgi:hypothetical protein